MTSILVPLTEERLTRLKSIAQQLGVTPEELARASLEEWLSRPRPDFENAARHVLGKNAELYRRLA